MGVVGPSKFLGSLRSLVGCAPVMSLLVVLLRSGVPVGVELVDRKDAGGAVRRLAALAARQGAQAVAAVFVDAAAVLGDGPGELCTVCAADFEGVSRGLAFALGDWGLPLAGSFVVERITEGGRWFDLSDRSRVGVLDDPACSASAASEGQLPGSCRGLAAAQAADVVRADPARAAALGRLLSRRQGPRFVVVSAAVRFTVAAARRHAAGVPLSDALLVWLAGVLMDARVRDDLYRLADSEAGGAAQEFWGLLSRVLPPPFRAEALALLAVSACLRGDAVLAEMAAEEALADNPGHRQAWMVSEALRRGVTPAQLRALLVPTAGV